MNKKESILYIADEVLMNEKKESDNSEKKNWYPEVASYYYFLMFVLHIHFN